MPDFPARIFLLAGRSRELEIGGIHRERGGEGKSGNFVVAIKIAP